MSCECVCVREEEPRREKTGPHTCNFPAATWCRYKYKLLPRMQVLWAPPLPGEKKKQQWTVYRCKTIRLLESKKNPILSPFSKRPCFCLDDNIFIFYGCVVRVYLMVFNHVWLVVLNVFWKRASPSRGRVLPPSNFRANVSDIQIITQQLQTRNYEQKASFSLLPVTRLFSILNGSCRSHSSQPWLRRWKPPLYLKKKKNLNQNLPRNMRHHEDITWTTGNKS